MSKIQSVVAVAIAALAAGPASASMLMIEGNVPSSTEQTGATFSGVLDYTPLGPTMGTLQISLTNTTAPSVGGFLTAFVFNIDSSDPSAASAQSSVPNANWSLLTNTSAVPFGNPYDSGSSTSSGFEGGGPPSRGLAVGQTGVWTFTITASDAASLTEASFINGPFVQDFIVRFRGLSNGGSDKVPSQIVPTPGALALAGLAGVAALRRRRN